MSARPCRNVSLMYRANARTALLRRVYPATALHRKVLAHAIGRHVDTINRICAGEGSASLEVIGDLGQFFRRHGDPTFLAEVFGLDMLPPPAAPAQIAAELKAMAQRLEAVA